MLHGNAAFSQASLLAAYQANVASQIAITEAPTALLGVPLFNPTFKGRVLDASGKGVAGVTIGVHDPVRLQSAIVAPATDKDGYWTYTTTTTLTEGEYPFVFILDWANGKTASCVLITRIVVYVAQGAVCGASIVGTGGAASVLACAPLVIHLTSDGTKAALDHMYDKAIIDRATWQKAQPASVSIGPPIPDVGRSRAGSCCGW
jgi:hypothetical protein